MTANFDTTEMLEKIKADTEKIRIDAANHKRKMRIIRAASLASVFIGGFISGALEN